MGVVNLVIDCSADYRQFSYGQRINHGNLNFSIVDLVSAPDELVGSDSDLSREKWLLNSNGIGPLQRKVRDSNRGFEIRCTYNGLLDFTRKF